MAFWFFGLFFKFLFISLGQPLSPDLFSLRKYTTSEILVLSTPFSHNHHLFLWIIYSSISTATALHTSRLHARLTSPWHCTSGVSLPSLFIGTITVLPAPSSLCFCPSFSSFWKPCHLPLRLHFSWEPLQRKITGLI